ncbi:nitrite reductase [Malaciobacter mytili]|uniref:NnrS family protein n=1 Tax=Malaciobacter mytili TaxID=603050 RepID=UPI00100BE926|nr:NnrS family protein [Malaciobacter mytili]RXI39667.1 nitrite reductase [Malaciobacter mytili]
MQKNEHYGVYPKNIKPPIYLAYAFRLFFLVLPFYIVLNTLLWALIFSSFIKISFTNDILTWHIYEFLYGIGSAGICAFILTAVPEFFKNEMPIINKKLLFLFFIWILGRISFWFIDFINIYMVAFINCFLLFYTIFLIIKPFFKDKKHKHTSILISISIIFLLQICFFASYLGFIQATPMSFLKLTLGFYMILILLVLRRVNMETINKLLEEKNINKIFLAKAFRYNIAIFSILLYSICAFFYPNNSFLAWLAFACCFSVLGILNDYFIKEASLFKSYLVITLLSIILLLAFGYFFIGYSYVTIQTNKLSAYNHFLTIGVFGLTFYLVMIVVSYVHTGRKLIFEHKAFIGAVFIIVATVLRVFYQNNISYLISASLFSLAFIFYFIFYKSYLLEKRVDNLPG